MSKYLQAPEDRIDQWIKATGAVVTKDGDHVLLFKVVGQGYYSDRSSRSRNAGYSDISKMMAPYVPGARLTAPDFIGNFYCGDGLHLSPTPDTAAAHVFSGSKRKHYLVCEVRKSDIWPIDTGDNAKCKVRSLRVLKEIPWTYTQATHSWNAYTRPDSPKPGEQFTESRSGNTVTVDALDGGYWSGTVDITRANGKTATIKRKTLAGNYRGTKRPPAKKANESLQRLVEDLI